MYQVVPLRQYVIIIERTVPVKGIFYDAYTIGYNA